MQTKDDRRKTAQRLIEERNTRSAREQWKHLDKKLGALGGARKERKRLLKAMGAPVCEHCEGEGCAECEQYGFAINYPYEKAS